MHCFDVMRSLTSADPLRSIEVNRIKNLTAITAAIASAATLAVGYGKRLIASIADLAGVSEPAYALA
jgi:hypothetical protein